MSGIITSDSSRPANPGVTPVYANGALPGAVVLDFANGNRQLCYLNEATVINVTGGVEGDSIELGVQYSTGAYTLDFDSSVKRPSLSGLEFPYTLESSKAFTLKFKKLGGYWQLVAFVGFYDQNLY